MEKILVSACLLGANVRYHGGAATSSHPVLQRWAIEDRLIRVCPEMDGGLSAPRPAAEIVGQDGGRGVHAQLAVVKTVDGADVTQSFLAGAEIALKIAKQHHIRIAILKDGSPSCGSAFTYDGSFSSRKRPDVGVTTAWLEANGVRVFSENQIDEAAALIDEWERVGS